MSESSLDLGKVSAAMAVLGIGADAAEFHGGICGLLCTRGAGAVTDWIRASGHAAESQIGDDGGALELLHDAEAQSWRELNGADLSFYPLLPDTETALAERVAALALWCQGFVAGLGLGGYVAGDAASEDDTPGGRAQVAELVDDFVEISRAGIGSEDLEDADRADFDLAALIEYVRVGVQLVFEELQAQRDLFAAATQPRQTH